MNAEQAEVTAIKATEWLAGDERRFSEFMNLTGVTIAEIRSQIGDPEFLASVLDFVLMDDRRIVQFCNDANLASGVPMQARQALPGGNLPHWT